MITLIIILIFRVKGIKIFAGTKKGGALQTGKNLVKNKIKYRVTLVIGIVLDLAIVIALVAALLTNTFAVLKSTAGYSILKQFSNDAAASANPKPSDDGKGKSKGSGGLYPKDPKLKFRAQLLETIEKSCTDAAASSGCTIEPEWILGSIYRESGNRIYTYADNNNISSVLTDLMYEAPGCFMGSACTYDRAGISHFYEGTFSGSDQGNPNTQVINEDYATYSSHNTGVGHAVGILQLEIPYVYSHLKREYGQIDPIITYGYGDSASVLQQVVTDGNLGFIRPNVFYLPDAIYNTTFSHAESYALKGSDMTNIIQSSDFQSLSKRNQEFIIFMYKATMYGAGSASSGTDQAAYALIKLAKSGQIENLDDMVADETDQYWSDSGIDPKGSWKAFIQDVDSRYNLGLPQTYINSSGYELPYAFWYGIYAGCVGKVAYGQMKALIDAAEKESDNGNNGTNPSNGPLGNWIDHYGSGIFGGDDSPYYDKAAGARVYCQGTMPWATLHTGSSTIQGNGCYICAVAMAISNLINQDITPQNIQEDIVNNGYAWDISGFGPPECQKYGLTCTQAHGHVTESELQSELSKGNIVLLHLQTYSANVCPWEPHVSMHWVAVTGIDSDGKYVGINSGGTGYGVEEHLTADQFLTFEDGINHYIIGA